MNTQDFIAIEEKFGAHNYHPLDVVINKAEGVWVYDVDGNKYMDCLAAYSAVNQGHCHPKVLEAFKEQAAKVTLTSRAFRNDKLPLLYQKLSEMTGYEMTLPMNSGAEAVETAIKAIRKWAYKVKGTEKNKAEILVADGNFHGRTTTIVSFSTDPIAHDDYGPYTPGFKIVKYGDIKDVLDNINENTAGVILEPIQGEGGIVIPPEGYLKEVKEACKKNNVLFALDEIQSGLGRTGKLFAYDWEDARPDMVIIGKALSAGFYPVSAVLSSKEILGVFNPGEHGSTYGGNPLGAAVSIKALEVIEEEKLVQRSNELGNYFIEQLRKIESPHIVKVRGRGLWIGFVLDTKARPYTEKLVKEGILAKETHENIIRFAPPLIITKEEIDWAVEKITKVVKELD